MPQKRRIKLKYTTLTLSKGGGERKGSRSIELQAALRLSKDTHQGSGTGHFAEEEDKISEKISKR